MPQATHYDAIVIGSSQGGRLLPIAFAKAGRNVALIAILSVEGGEIMGIIQVAMMGKLPYTALKEGIFTHPTLAEGLNNLFMTLDS